MFSHFNKLNDCTISIERNRPLWHSICSSNRITLCCHIPVTRHLFWIKYVQNDIDSACDILIGENIHNDFLMNSVYVERHANLYGKQRTSLSSPNTLTCTRPPASCHLPLQFLSHSFSHTFFCFCSSIVITSSMDKYITAQCVSCLLYTSLQHKNFCLMHRNFYVVIWTDLL